MAKQKRRYTPGLEDIERVLDHLDKKYKEEKRQEWLRKYSKRGRKEVKDENNSRP